MMTYPGLPGPVLSHHLSREGSRSRYDTGTEFRTGRIEMVAITGTYMDVPFHLFETGFDLTGLPLDHVTDLTGICVRTEERGISPGVLAGLDFADRAILFATGWDQFWRTERYGDPEHPFLTAETAEALMNGGARLVGIDSVNVDNTTGITRPAHTILLEAGDPHRRASDRA